MKERFQRLLGKRWFANAVSGCIVVVFYLIVSHLSDMQSWFSNVITYCSTVMYGCVLAYIMNPLVKLFERSVFKWIKVNNVRTYASVFLSVIAVIATFAMIMIFLIPQLFDSMKMFAANIKSYGESLQLFIKQRFKIDAASQFSIRSDTIINDVVSYISNNFSSFIDISASTGKHIFEWVVAFILSIYLLLERDRMKVGSKRLLHALLSDNIYNYVKSSVSYCNSVMSKYVSLNIIDGFIIGAATFIFMIIYGMPYAGLISVVVGVTNLVPTFGPIVGGVIGGFILLMAKPMLMIVFVIFIIFLQLFDGYILKPKLFGSSFGISGLWILIFILIGGNIFGVAGLLLAIPCATIMDTLYHEVLLKWLESKKANS